MIGGLYGKGKSREDWVGAIGGVKERNFKVHRVIVKVAISFFENFRMREEIRVPNCWYCREVSGCRSC